MRPQVVCDASAVVAMLLDTGPDGTWATGALVGADLAAPSVLPFETANIIRRQELAGLITADQGAQANTDLGDLAVEYWPYELVAHRGWQLRHNLTTYDAGYVAVAELLQVPLVTLDRRIARATGVRCAVTTP
ncbi:MAG: type II toxin-antitoxin system VapC family toxin [Dermatophilaceae bacterium]